MIVINRKELEITLMPSASWRSNAGPLLVTAINVRNDETGWINFPQGIQVADIIDDLEYGLPTVNPTMSPALPSSQTVMPSILPTPAVHKNTTEVQNLGNSFLTTFDVTLNHGEMVCSDFPKVLSLFSSTLCLDFNFSVAVYGQYPANLQVLFPKTPYYFGVCDTVCRLKLSTHSYGKLGTWPSSFYSPKLVNKCLSYSTCSPIIHQPAQFQQFCFENVCSGGSCYLASQRFRGQMLFKGPSLSGSPGIVSPSSYLTSAPSSAGLSFAPSPPSNVSSACVINPSSQPTLRPSRSLVSMTMKPTTSKQKTNTLVYKSIPDGIVVKFDALLQADDVACTEPFAYSTEVETIMPDLSFVYQVYSLDDDVSNDGLLQVYFPGNNMWFFATNHDESCYSYSSSIGFPLNFSQICIAKKCLHNHCQNIDSVDRYRGFITIHGYTTTSPSSTSTSSLFTESSFRTDSLKCHLPPPHPEGGPWTVESVLPWLVGLSFFILLSCCGFFYMVFRYIRDYRDAHYYDSYSAHGTGSRNPIPVMMEMVSPLYRQSRRNPRLTTAFSIPSDIMLPAGTQGMAISGSEYPAAKTVSSLDPAAAKIRNHQTVNSAEYEQLTTANDDEDEDTEEATAETEKSSQNDV
jgi:hypothetical protein